MLDTIDPRDVAYFIVGMALLGLSLQPALSRFRAVNLPLFYILAGALLGYFGLAQINPLEGGWQSLVVEHASELIVIISLAGAGLALDTVRIWRNWAPTWRLLAITMPITIVCVAFAGHGWLGLGLPSALLLAAALAPTDPVLAQSVQVGPPGANDEPMEVALTAEAGMNDGLAFPFVYLAIHAAAIGIGDLIVGEAWLWSWLSFDVLYRVTVGIFVGYMVGRALSAIIFSPFGDGRYEAQNAVVVILAATMLSYGITEAVDGYGFLAVFFAARAGRARTRGTEDSGYDVHVHRGSEQLETILLAVLLLWLGAFIGGGGLAGLWWGEIAFALILVLVIRPVAGLIGLLFYKCDGLSRRSVAFFGIRGMGSVFYIAYAQNHATFADIDAVWRIALVTIFASILIHGYAANIFLERPSDLQKSQD